MTSTSHDQRPVPSSLEVLAGIEESLARHLSRTPAPAELAPVTASAPIAQPLASLELNLARIQDCLDRASRGADDADGLLNAEIEALRGVAGALAKSGAEGESPAPSASAGIERR